MNMPDVPLLSMLRQQMTWLQARQSVLSQNVSNADTPGYTANDLKPMDFEKMLKGNDPKFQSGLLTTNDHHIAMSPEGTGSDSPDIQATNTGSSVSLEQEMIKVSETQAQFQAATNLYSKALSMMRTAIGKSGS